jgi:hypothetical protein
MRKKNLKTRKKLSLVGAVAFSILAACGLTFAPRAVGQGCAMCYQSAAASGSRSIHALRNGIIVLMIPPFFICTGISYLVYRRRHAANQDHLA